ncbi:MAG: hypothetical protein H6Q41_3375 [Deltaproteobacteria bacterium]|jgi:hypothetical protein|nr:hypothetical protein [Deltaproteobacteria bacterium]
MNLLEMLMGNSQTREGFKDFLTRFEEGPPSEGYEDQEVLDRYGEVAHKASPSDYEQAARDAFGHLSEADREEFGQLLAGQARGKGLDLSGLTPRRGEGFGDLDWLTKMTSQIHQQPGLLRDLLGGLTGSRETSSSGGILSSPLAKAALAGITAMLVKKVLGGR